MSTDNKCIFCRMADLKDNDRAWYRYVFHDRVADYKTEVIFFAPWPAQHKYDTECIHNAVITAKASLFNRGLLWAPGCTLTLEVKNGDTFWPTWTDTCTEEDFNEDEA